MSTPTTHTNLVIAAAQAAGVARPAPEVALAVRESVEHQVPVVLDGVLR